MQIQSAVAVALDGVLMNSKPMCFAAGSRVLMGDGTLRPIETIKVGNMVLGSNGPVSVISMDIQKLGMRKLLQFADGHTWSDDHVHWTKQADGAQWWWAYSTIDSSIRTGVGYAFAHLDGWKTNELKVISASPNTRLYALMTYGAPVVVNGYLVSAGINQAFDYTTIDWNVVREEMLLVRAKSTDNRTPPPINNAPPALPTPKPPGWAPPPVPYEFEYVPASVGAIPTS